MLAKVNKATLFLAIITVVLGGLSFFVVVKLRRKEPARPARIRAADKTYTKSIALAVPTQVPEGESIEDLEPTETLLTQEEEPTSELTPTESQSQEEASESAEITPSPASRQVEELPQSGMHDIPILIVSFALVMIFMAIVL